MPDPLDARERSQLCDLFLEVGPEAPTLCEGWNTADLAAHLVVRERDLRSTPGILLGGRFAAYTDRLMDRQKAKGYEATVARVRSGPPLPWRVPGLRELLNLQEYFVHHEDVRRANGLGPRTGIDDVQDAIWAQLRRGARFQLRRVKGAGVELQRPGGEPFRARSGWPVVRIVGEPGELLLRLLGRTSAAQVEVDGPPDAVAAFERARFGL
jgi:uncharacterized protein (TIGR03085 family)